MMQSKGKAFCLAVMLTVMLPAIAAAQAAVPVWGEWTEDQTVAGCIVIQAGDKLIIEEGVTVSFEEDGKLIVRGILEVNKFAGGCPSDISPVVFTRTGTTGGWHGIVVEDGGDLTLRYAEIMWALDTGLSIMSGACAATLDHVLFQNCSGTAGGALHTEIDLTIMDSSFVLNSAGLYGGAIEATGGTLTLSDVWLEGNSAGYSGGAIDLFTAGIAMQRGRIQGNTAPAGSGLALFGGGGGLTNVFLNNNAGGDVITRMGDTALTMNYCTFRANVDVAALAGDSDANVTVSACIMYGNGDTNVNLGMAGGTTTIQVSDVENLAALPGDWLGAGNIDADPLFVAANSYEVDPSSPVIGAAVGEDMGVTGGAAAPGPAVSLVDLAGDALADPYDMGTALVDTGIVRNVQLINDGQEAVEVLSAVITGAQAGAFGVDMTPTTLLPGGCLAVQLSFNPPAPGAYTFADLVITHSAGVIVNGLTGDTQEGTGTDLGLSDVLLNFGSELVDTTSMPMALTITNPPSNGGLVDVDLAVGGDSEFFTLSEVEFSIPSGGERTVWITFAPTSVRSYESIVTPTVNGVERADLGILLLGAGTELLISVDPDDYQFPPTQAGLSNDTTVTVTNEVSSSSIMVTATQPGSGYSVVPASAPIAAGGTADFTVIFAPSGEGFAEAELDFSATLGDNDQTVTVDLRGIGIPTGTGIAVSTNMLNFDDTSVGDTSSPESFTVTNLLDDFVVVTVTGAASSEFTLVSAGSFVLFPSGDPRAARNVTLTMSPSAAALFSDEVTVEGTLDGTAIDVGTEVVALQGRGTDAALDIAPDAIDFGDVEVNTLSSTVSVSVLNVGTEPVNIFAGVLSNNDDFVIVSESCSIVTPLEPLGLGCFYEVAATPQAEGTLTGELAIYSSDSALPTTIDLEVNGTPAEAAVISVDPDTVDMGDIAVFVDSALLPGLATITITNAGDTADLIVGPPTFAGYHAAQFAAEPEGPYPRIIAPGDSEEIIVHLQATGLGVRATTMTIPSNAGDEDVTITAVSQVGINQVDGFGFNENGFGYSFEHPADERIYLIPIPVSFFYVRQATVLGGYVLPADNFIWMEGPAFLEFMDSTGTWQSAATEDDIQSSTVDETLAWWSAPLPSMPAPVGEGLYTLHFGFDLVRDNMISAESPHYVDAQRTVVLGPKPGCYVDDTELEVGDAHPGFAAINAKFGASTTPVDVYVIAVDANGVQRWLDGTMTWQTGTVGRIGSNDVNLIPSPFAVTTDPWNGYDITDATQVGEHTITVIFDRSQDDVLNDQLFTASETITVTEVPVP